MDPQQNSAVVTNQSQAPPVAASTKYCLYARKSSEDDERQALSIDSQIKEMLAIAKRDGLNLVEIRKESHSAKASGMRPVYNQLVSDIRSGLFNGILTWSPDRIARNAGDLAAAVDMMDQGLLHEIRTPSQRFTNSPNEKFLLMILCSQAKLENDNRGVNVKRGQKARLEGGHRPCMAPLGYINEKLAQRGQSKVFIDTERAPIIKEMFQKVAYQFYTGRDLMYWINEEVKLRTRNGKKLTLSMIYRMLGSTFYYGEFEWPEKSGNWYKGTYEPIIDKELFQRARDNMVPSYRKGVPQKEFDFTRMLSCGICGSGVTPEEKYKKTKDGGVNRYVYYHCNKFADFNCKQPSIREEDLLERLTELIDKVNLDELGMREQLEHEVEQYKKLTSGVLGKMIDLQVNIPKVDVRGYAKHILKEGTRDQKRELLSRLASRLYLKDQKVLIGKEKRKKNSIRASQSVIKSV